MDREIDREMDSDREIDRGTESRVRDQAFGPGRSFGYVAWAPHGGIVTHLRDATREHQ